MEKIEYEYYECGNVSKKMVLAYGEPHSETEPAVVEYREDGTISFECWYRHGKPHRDQKIGPASIQYDFNGDIVVAKFYKNGTLSRSNGPASILKEDKETFKCVFVYQDNSMFEDFETDRYTTKDLIASGFLKS